MMMSAGDVAVMTSLRANVSWCKSSAWKRVKKVLDARRSVEKVLGTWKRVERVRR